MATRLQFVLSWLMSLVSWEKRPFPTRFYIQCNNLCLNDLFRSKSKKSKSSREIPDSYMECYPGAAEVAYESEDEEADYTKMDLGNKKGPIKRWDFESDEQYNKYMETREALPKAAFQFGIKMSEGRKTRRTGPKDEKAKLDRDWQRISKMIHTSKKRDDDDHDRRERRSKRD